MAILTAKRAHSDISNTVGALNTWTIKKLFAIEQNYTFFDSFNHWLDSTYRKSDWPTSLRFMIIDGDVISETYICSLKLDSSILYVCTT